MTSPIRLAFTMGDPAGIGPEITAKATRQMAGLVASGHAEFIVLGSAAVIQAAEERMGLPALNEKGQPFYRMVDVGPVDAPIVTGQISAVGGEWAYRAVAKAAALVQAGEADAIVTGPLSKEALHMAGHHFEGHTELLAHLTGQRDAVMMLAHGDMHVTHVTTHCAIADVPRRITPERLRRVLDVTVEALKALGIAQPRVAGDLLAIGVDVVPDRFEQVDGIGKGLPFELLERPLAHRIHQRIAAALGVPGKHVRVAPEHALRAKPEAAPARGALEQGRALPDLRLVTALEAEGPHERLALEVGADAGEGDGAR